MSPVVVSTAAARLRVLTPLTELAPLKAPPMYTVDPETASEFTAPEVFASHAGSRTPVDVMWARLLRGRR